eukprot:SAG31_NODE_7448_length_1687_cov_1.128463_2_plen_67_part_00
MVVHMRFYSLRAMQFAQHRAAQRSMAAQAAAYEGPLLTAEGYATRPLLFTIQVRSWIDSAWDLINA